MLVLSAEARSADALSDALLEQGALSVSVEDADAGTAAEVPLYGEPGSEAQVAWPRCSIKVLCKASADVEALLSKASRLAGLTAIPAHRTEHLEDEDWVRRSQAQFTPIRISDRLWVVPSWSRAPDASAINLILDPGVAFGTGSHATTRLCLRWLEGRLRGGEHVLDYGCGSGILAIAALCLGAGSACGVDIDAQALVAARANAERNRVDARFFDSETAPNVLADLVVANILANPLIMLAPILMRRLAPLGHIALSGILQTQAEDVIRAYAPWVQLRQGGSEDGWVLLVGQRT